MQEIRQGYFFRRVKINTAHGQERFLGVQQGFVFFLFKEAFDDGKVNAAVVELFQ